MVHEVFIAYSNYSRYGKTYTYIIYIAIDTGALTDLTLLAEYKQEDDGTDEELEAAEYATDTLPLLPSPSSPSLSTTTAPSSSSPLSRNKPPILNKMARILTSSRNLLHLPHSERRQIACWQGLTSTWSSISTRIHYVLSYTIPPLYIPLIRQNTLATDDALSLTLPDTEDSNKSKNRANETDINPLHISNCTTVNNTSWPRASIVLFISISYVGLLAYIIVILSTYVVGLLGVDSSTVGATLVALGSEVGE